MGKRSARSLGIGLAVFAALGASTEARADDVGATCATAAESAQTLRDEGKLRGAREQLLTCARDVCPEIIRGDCVRWLGDLEKALPTVVLRARDARGDDVIAVSVSMDGKPLVAALDGKAVAVDPGAHRFRFETATSAPVETEVLVGQGEHNRTVLVTFQGAAPPASAEGPAAAPTSSGRSVGPFITGGIGVVLLGAFAVLDLTAWSDVDRLKDGCGRTSTCSTSEVGSVDTRITLSKVALGAGLGALAAGATWYFLDAPTGHEARAAVGIRSVAGGATLAASARF